MNKSKALRVGILGMLALLVSACGGMTPSSQSPVLTEVSADPYRIGVGDMVSIHVWRNPELSQSIVVRPDGFISMPLMGDVMADGKQPETLAEEIRGALAELIRSPEVTVMVTNPVSKEFRNRVRITGQVMSPQSIAFRPGMTVLDIVLQAGGVTDFAAEDRAVLHRETGEGYSSFGVDVEAILDDGDMTFNYPLQPGDVISVPRKELFRGEL
ncbi:XrtA/PEP-CTERM system exopolysaccharide export protein [Marinobacter xestospongiae]|uniref:XrtA/PEP-CTERM system exopolysaccharide export protein n=1 Tax=Marinobacter xestospongiae TaxID=994319 RepID=UPI0020067E3B|nr:XrtA/PEP-CTERM system exopolysaccharide export protein [Marinobacter xestospongiae]MCK7566077.1 polysaccharide biosynthesis/export family protein [Marinobacter xestospongiae]